MPEDPEYYYYPIIMQSDMKCFCLESMVCVLWFVLKKGKGSGGFEFGEKRELGCCCLGTRQTSDTRSATSNNEVKCVWADAKT